MKNTRGPKTLKFTYGHIAELVGLKPRTVSNHSRDGTFDPEDLASLVAYINERTDWSGRAKAPVWTAIEIQTLEVGEDPGLLIPLPRSILSALKTAREQLARPEVAELIKKLDTEREEKVFHAMEHGAIYEEALEIAPPEPVREGESFEELRQARIKVTSKHARAVDPAVVAKALGAELEPEVCVGDVYWQKDIRAYRCEGCAWYSKSQPLRAAHPLEKYAPPQCNHSAQSWYEKDGKRGCSDCDMVQELSE